MAVSDGEAITVVKDMGLVTTVFDERTISCLPGHLAIGHTRYSTTGASEWRNAQPVFRAVGRAGLRSRPQRQPDQHGHPGREGRHAARCGGLRQRPRGRAPGPRVPRPGGRRLHARRGPRDGPAGRAPGVGRGLLLRRSSTPPTSSGCATPTGSGRCASDASAPPSHPRGGCWRRRRPPSTSSGPPSCASSSPARLVVIDDNGVRSVQAIRRLSGSTPTCASSSSSTSPVPTVASTGTRCTAARRRMGELLAAQAPVEADLVMGVPESGVPAAEGYARASRYPPRTGSGEEPLHRSHLHHSRPGRARATACGASSTRCARTSRASGSSSSTTPSCGARPSGPWSRMLREAGAPRGPPADLVAPVDRGPASTASTSPTATSSSRPRARPCRDRRGFLGRRLPRLPVARQPRGRHRRARRRVLLRLPDRELPRPPVPVELGAVSVRASASGRPGPRLR